MSGCTVALMSRAEGRATPVTDVCLGADIPDNHPMIHLSMFKYYNKLSRTINILPNIDTVLIVNNWKWVQKNKRGIQQLVLVTS